MDFGDADSEKWLEYARTAPFPLSAGFRSRGLKVRRYERSLGTRFDACSVNAPGSANPEPLCGDAHSRDPERGRPRLFPSRSRVRPRVRATTAGFDRKHVLDRPNVEAVGRLVGEFLPIVRRTYADVELYIVGMDPTPAVRRLADGTRGSHRARRRCAPLPRRGRGVGGAAPGRARVAEQGAGGDGHAGAGRGQPGRLQRDQRGSRPGSGGGGWPRTASPPRW